MGKIKGCDSRIDNVMLLGQPVHCSDNMVQAIPGNSILKNCFLLEFLISGRLHPTPRVRHSVDTSLCDFLGASPLHRSGVPIEAVYSRGGSFTLALVVEIYASGRPLYPGVATIGTSNSDFHGKTTPRTWFRPRVCVCIVSIAIKRCHRQGLGIQAVQDFHWTFAVQPESNGSPRSSPRVIGGILVFPLLIMALVGAARSASI
jgi:hypothetical protein